MQRSDQTRTAAALAEVLEQLDGGEIDATPTRRAHIAGARQALVSLDLPALLNTTTDVSRRRHRARAMDPTRYRVREAASRRPSLPLEN